MFALSLPSFCLPSRNTVILSPPRPTPPSPSCPTPCLTRPPHQPFVAQGDSGVVWLQREHAAVILANMFLCQLRPNTDIDFPLVTFLPLLETPASQEVWEAVVAVGVVGSRGRCTRKRRRLGCTPGVAWLWTA